MSKAIRTFRNVGSRVFRASMGTWHAGWTVHLGQEEARIHFEDDLGLDLHESLVVECYGDGTRVRFAARLTAQAGRVAAVAVVGSMTFEPSRKAVRFQVDNLSGRLLGDAQEASFTAMDVSPKSLGGVSDRPFDPGATLWILLKAPTGSFEGRAGVVNCAPDAKGSGGFRMGLRIVETSRLDAAMWQRLLEDCAQEEEGRGTAERSRVAA